MTQYKNNKKCLVIVPMKDPANSKTRLRDSLNSAQRKSLARLLYKQTLQVLQQAQALKPEVLFDLVVVTSSEEVASHAEHIGVRVIEEGSVHSLSGAVDTAAKWAVRNGYHAICMFPADLAAPDPDEVLQFIAQGMDTGNAVICPATDMGTNAIFVSPPAAIEFSFGENSAIRHMQTLKNAGLSPQIMPLESLRIDIDTSECLEQSAFRLDGSLQALAGA